MDIAISNGTAGAGAHSDAHPPDMAAHPSPPMLPDMPPATGGVVNDRQPEDLNLAQNASESSPALCRAGSRPEEKNMRHRHPDMQLGSIGAASQTTVAREAAEHWTVSERLDFAILWRAVELTAAEIAAHFGLSQRHLQRLRADFGLDIRPALRRLDRAARRRLVAPEEWAAFMTPRGQALLRVAQDRRRVQDEARDEFERVLAVRSWRSWSEKREEAAAAEVKRLRGAFRRGFRSPRCR